MNELRELLQDNLNIEFITATLSNPRRKDGPACVLMFGATIPVAVFAGVLGGVLGGPVAEFFGDKLPEGVHGTVANVTSMAICTIITAVVMQALPWF